MLISFPALTLDYLHCIASNYILLHYIALQYISLHYNPLRYTTLHCNDVIPRVLTGTHTYRYIHRNMDVYIKLHKYTDSSIDAYAHMYGKHPYTHTRQRYRDSWTHKCTTCYDVTLHFIYVDHVRIVHTSVHACFRCVHRPIHGKAFHNVHT